MIRIILSALIALMIPFSLAAQCPNTNALWETVSAPVNINGLVTTSLYAGDYTRVTGMQAGHTYRITTCGSNDFDAAITIYKQGGSIADAFNDDYEGCGSQPNIFFTPFSDGDYDILMNTSSCQSTSSTYTDVDISLIKKPREVITIPVVVHVVYKTSQQNISDNQVMSQIDVLNEDFRRMNPDVLSAVSRFKGYSDDMAIEFCLASLDPDGNPTTGITRTETNVNQFVLNDNVKFDNGGGHNAWSRNRYLNIWVCNIGFGILGYAQFPGQGGANTDGVVIGYNYFGRVGAVNYPFNKGRTATHEVGHWLGLTHIWGDGGCGADDGIGDTPRQGGENYSCPNNPTSCGNQGMGGDMSINFMDYTDDACMYMYTYGQSQQMRNVLNGFRSSLKTSNGCTNGNEPEVDFSANVTSGIVPLTVDFTDLTTGSPTQWNWTFNGAFPASATDQNPINITYQDTGLFTVTLEATNSWGTAQQTKFEYIHVLPEPGIPDPPFGISSENDEQVQFFPNPVDRNRFVEVKGADQVLEWKVFDAVGRSVDFVVSENGRKLHVADWPSGTYFIHLQTADSEKRGVLLVH